MLANKNIFSKFLKKLEDLQNKISLFPLKRKELCIMLILLIFILIGGGLRLYDLTSRSLGADEGTSMTVAVDILRTGYPPTTIWGEEYWRSLFHTSTIAAFFQFFGISVFVARLPSVIIGTLTILLIYFFGKELINWKVGLISSFLLSINVLAIDLSREARMYAFFQFFYLLSLFLFYKGFEDKGGKTYNLLRGRIILQNINFLYLILSLVAFIFSLLCHEGTVLIILGICSYAIVMIFIKHKSSTRSKKTLGKYSVLLLILIVMTVVGYLIVSSTSFGRQFLRPAEFLYFDLDEVFNSILIYGLYLLQNFPLEWCFATLAVVLILFKREKNGIFIITFFFIPLIFQLLFFHFDWIVSRYIYHLIPFFLILTAYGIYEVAKYLKAFRYLKVPENIRPRLFCILLCGLLIFASSSYAFLATQRGKIASPYWREACRYVLINSENETSLITSVPVIPIIYLEYEEELRYEHKEHAHKNISIYGRSYLRRSDLENFTSTHDNGWVLVDMDRWNWEEMITDDAKQYLQENLTYHPYIYHSYLLIYSWGYD